jgi:choline dehydrogenase-like flavoprotein
MSHLASPAESLKSRYEPPARPKPGLQFNERMAGFFHAGATDCREGFEEGKARGTRMSLALSIQIRALDEMLADVEHRASITGSVSCAALSAQPLTIESGEFRILAIDRDRVGAREMVYSMTLTSVEGSHYDLLGRKDVHDDRGFDLWTDTTRLAVSVSEPKSKEIGRGIVTLTPGDLVRLLSSVRVTNAKGASEKLRTQAAFARFFAGALYDVYGGMLGPADVHDGSVPRRPLRVLALPEAEVHWFTTDDGVPLKLTRYRGGTKGPVMLVAGMGTTSQTFIIDTVDVNLAEFLCAAGYDVWLFDYRASPAVPAVREQCTLDDIALHDYPNAIREIRRISGAESVQALGHCVGSATLLMSIASGRATEAGLRSAIASQFAMHFATTPLLRLKSALHLAQLWPRMGFNVLNARFDTRSGWKDRLYDRLLRFFPAYASQRCNSPVCRRIRFIYGETFNHEAINEDTHRLLYDIFGEANLSLLSHLATMIRAGHMVDRDGKEAYLPRVGSMTIPITFVQGTDNKIFLPKGSEETWNVLRNTNGPGLYERKVFPSYAHMDLFIGKNAHSDIFPYFLEQLDKCNHGSSQ